MRRRMRRFKLRALVFSLEAVLHQQPNRTNFDDFFLYFFLKSFSIGNSGEDLSRLKWSLSLRLECESGMWPAGSPWRWESRVLVHMYKAPHIFQLETNHQKILPWCNVLTCNPKFVDSNEAWLRENANDGKKKFNSKTLWFALLLYRFSTRATGRLSTRLPQIYDARHTWMDVIHWMLALIVRG